MDDYRAGWQATMKLLRDGRSFSGHERNCVFLNCLSESFANVSSVTGLDFPDDGRAVGVTDWDHDGDLDVWLANRTGPRLRLMLNETVSSRDSRPADHVSFRLQGTNSNRDAIGARVEVRLRNDRRNRLVQTLYGGDAYLSQSGKLVHFGLPKNSILDDVVVRWPNGDSETFADVDAGGRYRLIEGTGQAVRVESRRAVALKASKQKSPRLEAAGRRYLSHRFPMPIMRYTAFDDSQPIAIRSDQRPMLLMLWASWCSPCIEEFRRLQRHADALQESGLDVLALSVDGLDANSTTRSQDASDALSQLGFSFDAGMATRQLLDKLEVVDQIVYSRRSSIAVPTSYLLDPRRQLMAIYRGSVDFSRVLDDVASLSLSRSERRNQSVPFPGRWLKAPRDIRIGAVARIFKDEGHLDDYVRYTRMDIAQTRIRLAASESIEQREILTEDVANKLFRLGVVLASANTSKQAIDSFRQLIRLRPNHTEAHVNLGALLARKGQHDLAIPILEKALQLDPDSIPARLNLAGSMTSHGQIESATAHLREILDQQPTSSKAHSLLATVLIRQRSFAMAVEHLERAIRLNPRSFQSMIRLAWIRATSPVDDLRDATKAVQLSKRLSQASGGRDPRVLDILAAAFAEQGRFDLARQALARAMAGTDESQSAIRTVLESHEASIKMNRPIRDDDGVYP